MKLDADLPAWPRLLTRDAAAAYLAIAPDTFDRLCPLHPVDLPFSGLRWDRAEIDAWIAAMPRRARKRGDKAPAPPVLDAPAPPLSSEERKRAALEKQGCRTTRR